MDRHVKPTVRLSNGVPVKVPSVFALNVSDLTRAARPMPPSASPGGAFAFAGRNPNATRPQNRIDMKIFSDSALWVVSSGDEARSRVGMGNRANDGPPVLGGFSRRAWFPEHAEMVRLVYSAFYKVWGIAVDLRTDLLRLLWLNSGRVHANSVLLDSH